MTSNRTSLRLIHARPADLLACGLLTMIVSLLASGRRFASLAAGDLLNPDSYMRLARLEEILRRGSLVDVVPNDVSGHGMVLSWSHLLDAILLTLALPWRLVLDTSSALHVAAVMVGPFGMGALGAALAWAVAPFVPRVWLWTGPLLAALSPGVLGYGLPGILHHHVLLAVVAVMALGLAARAAVASREQGIGIGARLGAWAGVGFWLSPESMPFVLLAFGLLWLAWLTAPRDGLAPRAMAAGAVCLMVTATAFFIDPPIASPLSPFVDRLSVVYIALAFVLMLIGTAAVAIDRAGLSGGVRAGVALLIGTVFLSGWILAFPALQRGAEGVVDEAMARAMLGHILEMQPVRGTADILGLLLNATCATALMAMLAVARRDMLLGYAALCGVFVLAIGQSHVRFSTYAAVYAAAVLPVALAWTQQRLASRGEAAMATARMVVLGVAILSVQARAFTTILLPDALAAEGAETSDCKARPIVPLLVPYAGSVVLSDVDEVPELLYRTGLRTVGSLYHRDPSAFMRLRAAWDSPPSDEVPRAVLVTEADLLLLCLKTSQPYGRSQTLHARLTRGEVPPWLTPLWTAPAEGHMLYRVQR